MRVARSGLHGLKRLRARRPRFRATLRRVFSANSAIKDTVKDTTSTNPPRPTPCIEQDLDGDGKEKDLAPTRPTIEYAKSAARAFCEMPNHVLLILATDGDHDAREERLIREIMAVDTVTWEEAQPKLQQMRQLNSKGMVLATMPHKVGLTVALSAGVCSVPLCFNLTTAMWFNEHFVTTDVPPDSDLETWLEVGSWTWNWMEPPLGQISFFLLTLQFARSQLQNIGLKPYTSWLSNARARRMSGAYPMYNKKIVEDFAISDPL
eukprot:CAMPEP_0205831020 /NCGR_PEP_ID=MMETSP0206-20130828/42775_1 /ASSEMBLY_ACC=CAM_ASM_000279 /TAXON_ID=36767 /ORGANISM="Euplotes focardii, Strain TN1" /LENGTH=263 /DNA_ID=CAMNT_0053135233 /DNA_START=32 /DNA_END=823 /DNA_ORIENTATION=+